LSHRLPSLLIYVLSFTVIAIYWNNHHQLLRVTTNISSGVMSSNLILLFWLSLVPVTTQWVGDAYRDHVPAAYGVVSLGSAIAYYALSRAIPRANHHDRRLIKAVACDVKGVLSPILYALGVGLAFLSPYLAYGCFALVSMLWVVPDQRLAGHASHRHG